MWLPRLANLCGRKQNGKVSSIGKETFQGFQSEIGWKTFKQKEIGQEKEIPYTGGVVLMNIFSNVHLVRHDRHYLLEAPKKEGWRVTDPFR